VSVAEVEGQMAIGAMDAGKGFTVMPVVTKQPVGNV